MANTLSELLDVDTMVLKGLGVFDPLLDLDTRLFIDPHLLKHCNIKEFESSYENFQQNFIKILKLLNASDNENDPFWLAAEKLLSGNEVKGLCIGYASKGTSGSGIGPSLRKRLLRTADLIVKKGIDDPELFELVGMFEGDFGPDRISDMTANIIENDILNYTKNILNSLTFGENSSASFCLKTGLPINPYNKEAILLVPYSILRDLPVALDWSNMDIVSKSNQSVRENVNRIIGESWKSATKTVDKARLKSLILENPELMEDLISIYCSKPAQLYDFDEDRSGEYIWYPVTKSITHDNPLSLTLEPHPSIEEVENLVLKICDKFKQLVENNGLNNLFYNKDGTVKHESAFQLVFYGVADSYCTANNIMIARECDSGRGPVDFKFGTNKSNSVLVELKKSTNISGLKKGIQKQLPEYMKAEESKKGIYLVIDVGYTEAAIDKLKDVNELVNGANVNIFHVDGKKKASASKL